MTAINALANKDGAFIVSDTASYDAVSGRITGFPSKVFTFPHLSLAVASTGTWSNCQHIADQIRRFACYDDAIAGIADMVRESWNDGSLDVGDERLSHIRTIVAGWSAKDRCGEIYAVSTKEEDDAFTLIKRDVLSSPGFMPKDVLVAGGFLKPNGKLTVNDPIRFLTKTIEYQRHQTWPVPGRPDESKHIVGGCAVATVINASGIAQRVVLRWPDEIGGLIEPADDFEVTGLSRLQRDRMEKKVAKGQLQAA